MWLLTPLGFFSIVRKPADVKAGTLTVRARVRADLERLREACLPGLGEIVADAGTDYRYRAQAPRGEVGLALADLTARIDYANFKDTVAARQGKARAALYGKVWQTLYALPDEAPAPAAPAVPAPRGLAAAYGGVLVDAQRRVLLREPAGHYDGYVWTFPKGRPDRGETPEQTALREVREETGYRARILARLPGSHAGGTTVTDYFLMTPVGKPGHCDAETAAVMWATVAEAGPLIARTTNRTGRQRDLAVLAAAAAYLAANPPSVDG